MKSFASLSRQLAIACVALVSCTGQGPDVIDSESGVRSQVSIMAIGSGATNELAIVKEPDGISSTTAFADANGAPLGRAIDGIYESFDQLFLLHRATGTISVIDIATRRRLAEIGGFGDSTSALCGMAFSNLSQAWVIDHNSSSVYHVDAINDKLVDTFAIQGRPTSVATIDDKVFVASMLDDGSGLVSVFQSNFTSFSIDKTLTYPSPIVFMSANRAGNVMVLVSAGAPGGKPSVHTVTLNPIAPARERELDARDLRGYIGLSPEFAGVTNDNYLFIATPDIVLRVDIGAITRTPEKWLRGSFAALGVDEWSGLMYAYDPAAAAIRRVAVTPDGQIEDLADFPVPAPISAIEFVKSTMVR